MKRVGFEEAPGKVSPFSIPCAMVVPLCPHHLWDYPGLISWRSFMAVQELGITTGFGKHFWFCDAAGAQLPWAAFPSPLLQVVWENTVWWTPLGLGSQCHRAWKGKNFPPPPSGPPEGGSWAGAPTQGCSHPSHVKGSFPSFFMLMDLLFQVQMTTGSRSQHVCTGDEPMDVSDASGRWTW